MEIKNCSIYPRYEESLPKISRIPEFALIMYHRHGKSNRVKCLQHSNGKVLNPSTASDSAKGRHDGRGRGSGRDDCFSGSFSISAGPAATRQGGLPARRGAVAVPAGGSGGSRQLRRDRPLRDQEARASAPVPAVRRGNTIA